jgi:hypothetical protein
MFWCQARVKSLQVSRKTLIDLATISFCRKSVLYGVSSVLNVGAECLYRGHTSFPYVYSVNNS